MTSAVPCEYSSSTETASPDEFPPLRTLDSFPGNLPAQVSSFIGRQTDVIDAWLKHCGMSRVVTITGVGGVGKTRLALQVAAEVLPRYRDGAWLVELAPVREPDGVVEAVRRVPFNQSQRATARGFARRDVGQKQMLLVPDNCEHVLGSGRHSWSRASTRSAPASWYWPPAGRAWRSKASRLLALPPLEAGDPGDDIERLVHDRRRQVVRRAGPARQGGFRADETMLVRWSRSASASTGYHWPSSLRPRG